MNTEQKYFMASRDLWRTVDYYFSTNNRDDDEV